MKKAACWILLTVGITALVVAGLKLRPTHNVVAVQPTTFDSASSTLWAFIHQTSQSGVDDPLQDASVQEQQQVQAAVMTLFHSGDLGVVEQASSTELGEKVLSVSFPKTAETDCGIYGAPFCAFLLQKTDGSVDFLKVFYSSEVAKEFLPEGLLTYGLAGDGGFGMEWFSLIDLQTKQSKQLISVAGEAGCAAENYTLSGNGLTLLVENKEEVTDEDCKPLPDVYIERSSGTTLQTIHLGKDEGYRVAPDPLQTLRNPKKLYFSIVSTSTTRAFIYDGTVNPPTLIEQPSHAK